MPSKTIKVVAAVIIRDGKLFASQRGYGEWKDWWEFPGGKIEIGETPQDALKREIREELATEIKVGHLLTTVEYDYPQFHLTMHCYLCSIVSGQLSLLEHKDARWLGMNELDSVKWLPADIEVKNIIKCLDADKMSFATQKSDILDEATTQKTPKTTQNDLSATQKTVLDYFRNYPKGTRSDAANAIPELSEDGVKYIIGRLQQLGFLKREGGRKDGYWVVIER